MIEVVSGHTLDHLGEMPALRIVYAGQCVYYSISRHYPPCGDILPVGPTACCGNIAYSVFFVSKLRDDTLLLLVAG